MEETNIINLVKRNLSKEIKNKENKKKNFFRIFNNIVNTMEYFETFQFLFLNIFKIYSYSFLN
jgi:hypothetical protein